MPPGKNGDVMKVADLTVYDLVERGSELYPKSLAIVDGERRVTYGEFKRLVDSLANGLLRQGLTPEDRIGVVGPNNLEFFALFFASSLIGTIVVPVNTRLAEQEMQSVLQDAEPALIFADDSFQESLYGIGSNLNGVKGFFSLGKGGHHFKDFSGLLVEDQCPEKVSNNPQDGLAILYTAAVHGRAKGAILTNCNFIAGNFHQMFFLQLGTKDVHLNLLPLYHIGGLVSALAVFHSGGINIFTPKFEPERALECIEKEKVTLFTTFPPILSTLLDYQEKMLANISSLRCVNGLDHPDNISRFKKKCTAAFFVGYGQTETTGVVTFGLFDERPGSAGKPSPLARLKLIDEYDQDVPNGLAGEILVRGPLVFQGYWNSERDTEHTFRGGWHHTGDVGRFDSDGYLWYVKRKAEKELIKPGGENVYPAEVEKVILQFPGVRETVVIGVPHSKWGEGIKAVCVLKEGFSVTEQEIIDFVAGKIARYKKPHFVQSVSSLPKDEAGFIDREKVKAQYAVG
jgi:acyl-CoA synthetase (AMP-forming)/AMP-acid ligase II